VDNLSHLRNSYQGTDTRVSSGEKIKDMLLGYTTLNSEEVYKWDN